ncbi:MAG: DUF559 domain-containing protein [Solirubrobacterales bacterium]
MLDLAVGLELDELERVVAEAQALGIVTRRELLSQLERSSHRPGTPALRELLESDRNPSRTRSKAERMLLALIRDAALPSPETNAVSRKVFEADRRRDSELQAIGFRVLRFTWRRLVAEPRSVVSLIAVALDRH